MNIKSTSDIGVGQGDRAEGAHYHVDVASLAVGEEGGEPPEGREHGDDPEI